ncbi:MAG TPA: TolC family protein [Gemmatimonadaceae bacterium]|nr:TolC family protein [Gemmatimonadaceae bacterium]
MRRATAILALLAAPALPLRAQQPTARPPAAQRPTARPPASRPLSLAEALRLAERSNPDYRQVANDVDVSEAQQRRARATYLPTLSASMNFNGSGSQTLTGQDDFGNPIRGERRTVRSSSASQGLSLSMLVFDGGGRERRIDAAGQQVAAAEAAAGARQALLHAQVAQQYYRAVSAAARIALEERLLQSAREQYDATQRRYGIGAARREDLLGAETEVANAEASVETARGEARKAQLLLRQLIGLDPGAPFALTDSIPRPSVTGPLDADSLVRVALAANPRLDAAAARVEAAERSAAAERGSRWPQITASAGYSRSDQSRDFGSFFDVTPAGARGFSFGLSTRLPIFDGFQLGAQLASLDAQAEDARQQLRAERLQLEQEVRSAAIDVENAWRGLRLAERSAELSRERVALTQERYQVGGVDYIVLQTVLGQAAAAERQEMNARLQLAIAWTTLQEKLGASVMPASPGTP